MSDFPHDDYRELLDEIKAALSPPDGAFTMNMFVKDMEMGRYQARQALDRLVADGRVQKVGKYTGENGHSAYWYLPVKP